MLAIIIHSKEGIAQGCVLSINAYGVATLPLMHDMRVDVPQTLPPWFANDTGAAGKVVYNIKCLAYLVIHGPRFGYYPEPAKSWYICKPEDEEVARQAFIDKDLGINYTRSQKYLGGFIGSADSKEGWLNEKVADWSEAVQTLAKIAVKYPQAAYPGFSSCLQNEWQYVLHVYADTTPLFNLWR